MSWLDKIVPSMGRIQRKDRRASVPDGLWRKCPKCEAVLYLPELEKHNSVCPKCDHHLRLTARKRLDWFLDKAGREELAAEIEPNDRLKFRDSKKYKDRLSAAQKETGEKDALVAMRGELDGLPVVAVAFEFTFMGGLHGRRGWREVCARSHPGPGRKSPVGLLCRLGRGAHAGSAVFVDANGQNVSGA